MSNVRKCVELPRPIDSQQQYRYAYLYIDKYVRNYPGTVSIVREGKTLLDFEMMVVSNDDDMQALPPGSLIKRLYVRWKEPQGLHVGDAVGLKGEILLIKYNKN